MSLPKVFRACMVGRPCVQPRDVCGLHALVGTVAVQHNVPAPPHPITTQSPSTLHVLTCSCPCVLLHLLGHLMLRHVGQPGMGVSECMYICAVPCMSTHAICSHMVHDLQRRLGIQLLGQLLPVGRCHGGSIDGLRSNRFMIMKDASDAAQAPSSD